ncbi:MAG: hypothetical protein Q9221_006049 [Calogaya cf. arnoldii]
MSRQLPLKRKRNNSHQPEIKKIKLTSSCDNMHKDSPASIGAGLQYRGCTTNAASYSATSAKDKEVDEFLTSITARSPHSFNNDEEEDEMDALIRSACPDNLDGQKCKQSACRGLRLCPKFNTRHKTCNDAASCGLLHIRTTCKALLIGERCNAETCDMGHDHPAARLAVDIKRHPLVASIYRGAPGSTQHYFIPPKHLVPAVKLDSRDTPPPLHFSPVTSEQERSSVDTTPIGTPKTFDNTFRRRSDKVERERDLLSSYYRKTRGFAGNTSSYVDSALLESDFEDSTLTFPLFQDSSASDQNMEVHSAFAPRRHQTSNLTSALQSTSGNESRPTPAMNIGNGKGSHSSLGHRDSLSSGLGASGSHHGSGTHPISMSSANRERPRRESLAGSMVSGMSWGGISVGSWVRDEYECPYSLD